MLGKSSVCTLVPHTDRHPKESSGIAPPIFRIQIGLDKRRGNWKRIWESYRAGGLRHPLGDPSMGRASSRVPAHGRGTVQHLQVNQRILHVRDIEAAVQGLPNLDMNVFGTIGPRCDYRYTLPGFNGLSHGQLLGNYFPEHPHQPGWGPHLYRPAINLA
jgi:hypothetical protein